MQPSRASSGEVDGQLSWAAGPWSERRHSGNISAIGRDCFQPWDPVVPGRPGAATSLSCRVSAVLQHEVWHVDSGIYVLKLFLWKGQGEEGKEERRRRKNRKQKERLKLPFLFCPKKSIWHAKRECISKTIIDMKVHWKCFSFSRMKWWEWFLYHHLW